MHISTPIEMLDSCITDDQRLSYVVDIMYAAEKKKGAANQLAYSTLSVADPGGRGLSRGSAAASFLGLWVRVPPRGIDVCLL